MGMVDSAEGVSARSGGRCGLYVVAASIYLTASVFSAYAQAPSNIAGRTIQLTISTGSGPFANTGAYRFLPSSTDNSYAIVPISGPVLASSGAYSYAKLGSTTAVLSFTDSVVGSITGDCTFTTPSSGTYVLSSSAVPGASQAGTFTLYAGPSPSSIAGTSITVVITSGVSPFASTGSYQFLPASSGNTYSIVGLSGVANSFGTYVYNQNAPTTGFISYDDSVVGTGYSAQLSFSSITNGTVYLRKSGTAGYQTGIFTLPLPGKVVAWGWNAQGQTTVPTAALNGIVAIAAGGRPSSDGHSVALKYDGTVIAWGYNANGQASIPPSAQSEVTAIAAGGLHTVALKSDGTVVAWGYNGYGEVTGAPTNPPFSATASPVVLDGQILTGVVAIAAGGFHTIALKQDGTVVAWGAGTSNTGGDPDHGQSQVPVGLTGVKAIAAGVYHTIALKSDGTVVAWGWNGTGQCSVPGGLSGVAGIAAGWHHTVAVKSDGTVVTWGSNYFGERVVPAGLQGVVAISAGREYNLALKSDGSVVGWGYNGTGQTNMPSGLSGVTAIAAGGDHALALVGTAAVPPLISNTTMGNNMILHWPQTAWGFRLQSVQDLSQPVSWSRVDTVFYTNNGYISTILPISETQKFFRLIRP